MMELLNKLNACQDAKLWAAGKTLSQAWQECQRADWMLWLLGRSSINKKTIAAIAVEIAETCAHNAKDYPAVAKCIAVVKRFLAGEATQKELAAAESSAWSAVLAAESAEESAARAAALAAGAARLAADSAESAALAAESAALAARSAALAAESSAWSAVLAAELAAESSARAAALAAGAAALAAGAAAESANCEIIRKHVSADEICKLFRKDGVK